MYLPKYLDEKVARLHLAKIGVELDVLDQHQADYIGVPVEGPFKAGCLQILNNEARGFNSPRYAGRFSDKFRDAVGNCILFL